MGLITNQIRKRSNQRLAEPLTTTTVLSIPETIQALKQICDTHNRAESAKLAERRTTGNKLKRMAAEGTKEHTLQYHVLVREQDVLIGYQHSPQYILANAKQKLVGWSAGWWLAMVRFPKPAEPLPPGQYLVEVRLTKWVTNSDGKLENKHKYEALTNALWEAVSADAM